MDIVAVKHGNNGKIEEYKLYDGTIINSEEAVNMVEYGKIEGYNIATAKNGVRSIRSNRDETTEDNLSNLPKF